MADTKLPLHTVQRKPKLDSLPQEVYDLIFKHASSPRKRLKRYLWPLLFVSKRMYHAVLPALYRRISFNVHSSVGSYEANYKLLQLADKENQGLLHIQAIVLCPDDELERKPHDAADYPDAIQLLAAIPRNQLRKFRSYVVLITGCIHNWNSWHQLPSEVLRLLWKRQYRLTNIELIACDIPLDKLVDNLNLGEHSFHQHATDLLVADVRRGLIAGAALDILENRPSIDALDLEFWGIKEEIGNLMDLRNLDDNVYTTLQRLKNAYQDGLLRDLFGTPNKPVRTNQLSLVTLGLHGADLSHSPQYIFHAINLAILESLEIVGCYRTDVFLAAMAHLPVNKRPRLRQLDISVEEEEEETAWVSDADHTDRTVSSINEVLLSMKDNLDNLWIVIRGIDGPGKLLSPIAHGIANQGRSLRCLTIDVRNVLPISRPRNPRQDVGWSPREAWEQICASMVKLEQLYVPIPPIVVDEHMSSRPEFRDYLTTALQIPTLKTLNINTWPYPFHTRLFPPGDHRPYEAAPYIVGPYNVRDSATVPEDFYHHCLEYVARDIVALRDKLINHPTRRLDIIGFGLPEEDHYMAGLKHPLEPVYFVSESITSLGKPFTWIRQASLTEIEESSMHDRISEVQDVDWLAKRGFS